MNLSKTIAKSLAKGLFVFALCAIYMASVWFKPFVVGTDEDVMDIREHTPGSPVAVIEKSGCVKHSGSSLPTGVVYQTVDGTAHHSTNPVVIGKALDEEIGGKVWKRGKTNMFCL